MFQLLCLDEGVKPVIFACCFSDRKDALFGLAVCEYQIERGSPLVENNKHWFCSVLNEPSLRNSFTRDGFEQLPEKQLKSLHPYLFHLSPCSYAPKQSNAQTLRSYTQAAIIRRAHN